MTVLHPDEALPTSWMLPARPDAAFDRLAQIAQRHLGVPLVLVALVSRSGQIYPGAAGLPAELDADRFSPLTDSFCRHVVASRSMLVIEEVRRAELLADGPANGTLGIVAYAGFPLVDETGTVVGALAAVDHEPRVWDERELALLRDIADSCSSELRLRGEREQVRQAHSRATRAARQAGVLLLMSDAFHDALTIEDVARTVAGVAESGLGTSRTWISIVDHSGRSLTHVRTTPDADADVDRERVRIDEDTPTCHVARTRESLFFADHAEMIAAFPALRATAPPDGGAVAVLPLVAGHRLDGVLTLAWDAPRDFATDNRALKNALAAYTAQALERAQLFAERRDVARTLQEAMLTALPQPPQLRLVAHYLPAGRADAVGGDWYDAIVLPDDAVAVMVGDVTGHDMDAAARMGQLRSSLRTLAWDRPDQPSAWLQRLDRTNEDIGLRSVATVLAGRCDVDPAGDGQLFTWSSAGHPAPILIRPGEGARVLDRPNDLIIGIAPDTERHDHSQALQVGDVVLLYTDGLVERRDESLVVSVATLAEAAGALQGAPPDELVTTLARRVVTDVPGDDVVLLAIQVLAPART
ncbi:MAG TPA: GAF domain-containing SpoIIE family protein phosphatase [Cellulomonas sp.]|uniref:GAF domain-containing SpoIIE family protein phosphatase n=1 Tax=Cellulomonas sp. TaxID=40001 RepID=UPI002E2F12C2|nr:GAF domain-containing SpoIIE family protein phosphatase [Cellulomonas sp.]HEX5332591.1 GAF domain-containing SpoIIE family protein phosphatase [Cellulomonas sp.]